MRLDPAPLVLPAVVGHVRVGVRHADQRHHGPKLRQAGVFAMIGNVRRSDSTASHGTDREGASGADAPESSDLENPPQGFSPAVGHARLAELAVAVNWNWGCWQIRLRLRQVEVYTEAEGRSWRPAAAARNVVERRDS